jgi:hypothetical protein
MRRFRRNSDERLRRIERAYAAGDQAAFTPLVNELKRVGRNEDAVALVRADMIRSGGWYPFPRMREHITSYEQAQEENRYNLLLASEAELACPWLIVETREDPSLVDVENAYFNEGPYRVEVSSGQESYYRDRVMEGASIGERGIIPIWQLFWMSPESWRGVNSAALNHLSDLGADPTSMGGESVGHDDREITLYMDAPTILERENLTWESDVSGFLVRALALRQRLETMGHVLLDDDEGCDEFCWLHAAGCGEGHCYHNHFRGHRNACLSDQEYHANLRDYFGVL